MFSVAGTASGLPYVIVAAEAAAGADTASRPAATSRPARAPPKITVATRARALIRFGVGSQPERLEGAEPNPDERARIRRVDETFIGRPRRAPAGSPADIRNSELTVRWHAWQVGAPGFEPGTSATQRPRATRLRHAPLPEA